MAVQGAHRQAQEILQLQCSDHHSDAAGEAHRHRIGHQFDEPPQPRQAHEQQDHARHGAGGEQAAETELLGDGKQDHDEGGSGAGDVDARPPGQCDDRARYDGRVEAMLGGNAAGDGQCHGQRQGNDADGGAGGEVADDVPTRIAAVQDIFQGLGKRQGLAVIHGGSFIKERAARARETCVMLIDPGVFRGCAAPQRAAIMPAGPNS